MMRKTATKSGSNPVGLIVRDRRDALALRSADEDRRVGQSTGVSDERMREIRAQAEYHRETIIELAKR